jgi:hypothetical protein
MNICTAAFDPFKPDCERFPGSDRIHRLRCDLEPGDALLLPGFWFHAVQIVEPSMSATRTRSYMPSAVGAGPVGPWCTRAFTRGWRALGAEFTAAGYLEGSLGSGLTCVGSGISESILSTIWGVCLSTEAATNMDRKNAMRYIEYIFVLRFWIIPFASALHLTQFLPAYDDRHSVPL